MATQPTPSSDEQPRDARYWSPRVATSGLKLSRAPTGALNLNVEGRQIAGPLQGFGPMWQKIYRVSLQGASVMPTEVIKAWKENFPKFWPSRNYFYAPLTGIAPGEVVLINMEMPGGMPLSTGVLVLYADDESFTLMTPEGHMFCGWITFSAYEEDNHTVAQAEVLMRSNDPLYEIGMRLFGHKREDLFWQHTLTALAAHFGVNAPVETRLTVLDPRLQWSQARNIWHNAAIRTTIYKLTAPLRRIRRLVKRRSP